MDAHHKALFNAKSPCKHEAVPNVDFYANPIIKQGSEIGLLHTSVNEIGDLRITCAPCEHDVVVEFVKDDQHKLRIQVSGGASFVDIDDVNDQAFFVAQRDGVTKIKVSVVGSEDSVDIETWRGILVSKYNPLPDLVQTDLERNTILAHVDTYLRTFKPFPGLYCDTTKLENVLYKLRNEPVLTNTLLRTKYQIFYSERCKTSSYQFFKMVKPFNMALQEFNPWALPVFPKLNPHFFQSENYYERVLDPPQSTQKNRGNYLYMIPSDCDVIDEVRLESKETTTATLDFNGYAHSLTFTDGVAQFRPPLIRCKTIFTSFTIWFDKPQVVSCIKGYLNDLIRNVVQNTPPFHNQHGPYNFLTYKGGQMYLEDQEPPKKRCAVHDPKEFATNRAIELGKPITRSQAHHVADELKRLRLVFRPRLTQAAKLTLTYTFQHNTLAIPFELHTGQDYVDLLPYAHMFFKDLQHKSMVQFDLDETLDTPTTFILSKDIKLDMSRLRCENVYTSLS